MNPSPSSSSENSYVTSYRWDVDELDNNFLSCHLPLPDPDLQWIMTKLSKQTLFDDHENSTASARSEINALFANRVSVDLGRGVSDNPKPQQRARTEQSSNEVGQPFDMEMAPFVAGVASTSKKMARVRSRIFTDTPSFNPLTAPESPEKLDLPVSIHVPAPRATSAVKTSRSLNFNEGSVDPSPQALKRACSITPFRVIGG